MWKVIGSERKENGKGVYWEQPVFKEVGHELEKPWIRLRHWHEIGRDENI